MGFLGDLASNTKNLLGISGEMPTTPQVGLDDASKRLIAQQGQLASLTPEDRLNKSMEGVDQTGALQNAHEQGLRGFNSLGNVSGNELNDAIQRKYSRQYDVGLNDVKREQESQNPQKQFQDQAAYASSQMQQFSAQAELADRARTQELNRKAARNQVIGSVLGLGGAAIGFAVGGPAGASAGAKIGGGFGGGTTMRDTAGRKIE